MRILGVLKAPEFYGLALDVNFNIGIVDVTGRHTLSSNGVTTSSGKGVFHTVYLDVLNKSTDFSLQDDFDFSFRFDHEQGSALDAALVHIFGGSTFLTVVYGGSARVGIKVKSSSTGTVQTAYSSNNIFTVGVEALYKIVKRGSSLKLFFNSTLAASITLATPFGKVGRVVRVGVDDQLLYYVYGRYDDIAHRILKKLSRLDFEALPFVDSTVRHTIDNYGATFSSGSAVFANPADNSTVRVEILGNQDDFSLQRDFDVNLTVNIPSFAGRNNQILFSIEDAGNTSLVECYVKNTGQVYLNFPAATFSTSTGIITAGVDHNIRIERRGTSAQIWVNDVARAIVAPSVPALANVPRKIVLGAATRVGGYGINGSMSHFYFDIC